MENLYTITQVFAEKLFRVPDYQRGYAWEKQQCREFIEDLELLEPERTHFLGTLILHKRNEERIFDRNGGAYMTYDIVDGQQRLTTIVILLKVVAGYLAELEDAKDLVATLQQNFLVGRDQNKQPLPKLALNDDSRTYFNQVILGQGAHIAGPTIRSHERLSTARGFFQEHIRRQQENMGPAFGPWLEALYRKLSHKLTLMVYIVEREADAGIIFETMNNRGKPITELEKVKNYLLYLAGKLHLPTEHQLVARINNTWKHIFESLMVSGLGSEENENQLLRVHWLMAYDPRPANWAGSRSVKERFNLKKYDGRHDILLERLNQYLNALSNAVTAYCDVFRPGRADAFQNFAGQPIREEIKDAAIRLARVGSLASFLPLLMALRIRYPQDGAAYAAVAQLCEKYAFRVYRWRRLRSNAGQTNLFRLGHDLFHKKADLNRVQARVAELVLYYASDGQIEAIFADEDFNWYSWSGLKYFLYEYESHLAREKGVPVRMPYEEIARKHDSIEHILPQTKDSGGYWRQRFPRSAHPRWLNDLGNLTLTYHNTELRNRPFIGQNGKRGKVDFYRDSSLFIEKELADLDDWTIAALEDRRERLMNWALERWHVEPPAWVADEVDTSEGPTLDDIRLIFNRRWVPRGQQQLYKALYDAGDRGLTNSELVQIMGRRDRADLSGVLGALGRRINGTPGYGRAARPGINMLMHIERAEGNQWRYYLLPQTTQVLEELNPSWLQVMTP